jgi:adenylate cyclase, class 2
VPNIEIKAVYPDLFKARRIAKSLKVRFAGRDRQVDTYFKVSQGRLKLRESSLSGAQLVPYVRPDRPGPKMCDYAVIPVTDARKVKRLFQNLLGVDAVVVKQREIFLAGNVRIHLDLVRGLGTFIEFEAVYRKDSPRNRKIEISKVEKLLRAFEIPSKSLLKNSYREMIKK